MCHGILFNYLLWNSAVPRKHGLAKECCESRPNCLLVERSARTLWWECYLSVYSHNLKTTQTSQNYACCPSLWHRPPLMALWYVMYFRFYGWCHVFILWGQWTESSTALCLEEVCTITHISTGIKMWQSLKIVQIGDWSHLLTLTLTSDYLESHVSSTSNIIPSFIVDIWTYVT